MSINYFLLPIMNTNTFFYIYRQAEICVIMKRLKTAIYRWWKLAIVVLIALQSNIYTIVRLLNNWLALITTTLSCAVPDGQVACWVKPQSCYQHDDNNKLYIYLMAINKLIFFLKSESLWYIKPTITLQRNNIQRQQS